MIYDFGNVYSIFMSWGIIGLIYNSKLLFILFIDWEYFWENWDLVLKWMILVNDVWEVMGCVLRKLGYFYNFINVENIK